MRFIGSSCSDWRILLKASRVGKSSLLRDVLTGRIVTADNVTESTKERVIQVLASGVALGLPVI